MGRCISQPIRNFGGNARSNEDRLSARASFKPIQTQYVFGCILQPSRHLSHLEGRITWLEVAIEYVCDFFSRTWPPDLVQRPLHTLIEAI